MSDDEADREAIIAREAAKEGSIEFRRTEMRRSSKTRLLDCHCTIGRGDLYRYTVFKVWRQPGVVQNLVCDVCMRHGDHYYRRGVSQPKEARPCPRPLTSSSRTSAPPS
jgi:hypothetical protein